MTVGAAVYAVGSLMLASVPPVSERVVAVTPLEATHPDTCTVEFPFTASVFALTVNRTMFAVQEPPVAMYMYVHTILESGVCMVEWFAYAYRFTLSLLATDSSHNVGGF